MRLHALVVLRLWGGAIAPATAVPFEIVTSKTEDVPPAIKKMILEAFKEDEKRLSEEIEEKYKK